MGLNVCTIYCLSSQRQINITNKTIRGNFFNFLNEKLFETSWSVSLSVTINIKEVFITEVVEQIKFWGAGCKNVKLTENIYILTCGKNQTTSNDIKQL